MDRQRDVQRAKASRSHSHASACRLQRRVKSAVAEQSAVRRQMKEQLRSTSPESARDQAAPRGTAQKAKEQGCSPSSPLRNEETMERDRETTVKRPRSLSPSQQFDGLSSSRCRRMDSRGRSPQRSGTGPSAWSLQTKVERSPSKKAETARMTRGRLPQEATIVKRQRSPSLSIDRQNSFRYRRTDSRVSEQSSKSRARSESASPPSQSPEKVVLDGVDPRQTLR